MNRPAQWITDKYIYLMLAAFPLFTGFRGYLSITLSKYLFFVIVTGLWLMLLVFFGFREKAFSFRPAPVHLASAAFLLICCLSALLSPFGTQTLLGTGRYDGLITTALYILIFLGVSAYGRVRSGYIRALAFSTTVTCGVALLQLLGKNPLWLFPAGLNYYDSGVRYTSQFLGTIGNANLFSAFLCLSLPVMAAAFITKAIPNSTALLLPTSFGFFILAASGVAGGMVGLLGCGLLAAPLLLCSRSRLERSCWLAAALSAAAGLALAFHGGYYKNSLSIGFTFEKSSLALLILAAVLALAALLLCSRRDKPALSPQKLRLGLILAEVILAAGAVAFLYLYPFSAGGTVYELSRVLHGELQDSFGSSRILIWRQALALVPEFPLFGSGPDTLAARLDVEFSKYIPELGRTLTLSVDNAHNEYLGHLVNTGALGLLAYLTAMGFSLLRWFRERDRRPLLSALGCGLVCYWIQGFFGLGLCLVAPVMWLLWGLFESKENGQTVSPDKEISVL